MKNNHRTFLTALTFLFLLSPSAIAENKVWVNDMADKGRTDLGGGREVLKKYYDNGNPSDEIHYKDGKKDGMVTVWYPNGKKKSTSHYKNDIENGFRKEWDENGKLLFQGNFVGGNEVIE